MIAAYSHSIANIFFSYHVIQVIPIGHLTHTCQEDLVLKVDIEDVPYFNAPIFLENKEQVGKIDEIFGTIKDHYVSVNLGENFKAKSFTENQKVIISMIVTYFSS